MFNSHAHVPQFSGKSLTTNSSQFHDLLLYHNVLSYVLFLLYHWKKCTMGRKKLNVHIDTSKQMNNYQMYVNKILQRTQWLTRWCYVPNCSTYNFIVLFGHLDGLLQVQQLFTWHWIPWQSTSLPSSESVMDCCAVDLLIGSCHSGGNLN